jgi:hypothetical protein
MAVRITDREPQVLSIEGARRRLDRDPAADVVVNSVDADTAPERDDCFVDHPLTEAVRNEVQRYLGVSDADIAWIVEATLWQLARLVQHEREVDLDYLGHLCLAGERSFVWLRPDARDAMDLVLAKCKEQGS